VLQVVWFKRDLRMHDHAPLVEAAKRGPVLPLYVVEPEYWALPDTSARQWAFIEESLTELDQNLTALGQPLVMRIGDVPQLLKKLHARHGIAHVWSHEETGNLWTYARDKAVAAFCKQSGIGWTEIPQFGVVRKLKNRDRWASGFERFMDQPLIAAPKHLPTVQDVDPGTIPSPADFGLEADWCPGRQRGGRKHALLMLNSFFGGRGRNYQFEMSSPLTAATSCSRLSTHLSTGDVSLREVLQRAYGERKMLASMPLEQRAIQLLSVDSFVARLHWHCHFIQKLESEPEIELRSVHPLFEAARLTTAPNHPHLLSWIEGRTGFPFFDACMRSLIATGWINFRMRAMLMSFACYHLALDWRISGTLLAKLFTDYEPGIHWPQVQMQAGQTGINTPRMYNPVKQSMDQDKDGIFMRQWLPELANLPIAFLHEPWRMTSADQLMHGVVLGENYPVRIIEHEHAAREAKARITLVRQQSAFKTEAKTVYIKHGSRKRTLRDDNPSRSHALKAQKTKKAALQLDLSF
jgi:deoxyribodipyrimidine photo-lyase